MIVDTSALLAVFRREPESTRISDSMLAVERCWMSAGNLLEAAMVAEGRQGPSASSELDEMVARFDIGVVPFTLDHLALAREAFRRFGKGRHPARLNFGDCMAYALAKERGEPLLFKGGDFAQTDIEAAAW